MESLDGKVAWITGAGSGIGRACAVAFARAGARVALTGRRLPPLEETAVLTGAPAGDVVIALADVSDAAAVAAAHAKIVAALGDPLVLVNSAGGNVKQRHWGNLAPASASEVIDLDLKAMFYCTLAALPAMRARGDGRIVHIASQAGVSLTPITGPSYMAAKHAVVALSRVHRFGQPLQNVARLVNLATLDRRIASKGAADRLGQRLRAIDDEQASHGWIESTLDEIVDERLHRRRVFGRALDEAERMFVAVRVDPDRRDEEHIFVDVNAVDLDRQQIQVVKPGFHPRLHARRRQRHEAAGGRRLRHSPRQLRIEPHNAIRRKLRPLVRTTWWSEMDSNQRYLSPYCLTRSRSFRSARHRQPWRLRV